MVTSGFQFTAATDNCRGDLRRAARRFGIQRRGKLLQTRIKWIEEYQTMSTGKSGQHPRKGIAELNTGLVRSAQKFFQVATEFRFRQSFEQRINGGVNGFIEKDASDRYCFRTDLGRQRHTAQRALAVDEPGSRYFGKVVIFGCNPKNRHRFDAALR